MVHIPYGKTVIEYDEGNANVLCSRIDELKAESDGLSIVRAAMENPIDSPRLCELAKGKKKGFHAVGGCCGNIPQATCQNAVKNACQLFFEHGNDHGQRQQNANLYAADG